ncbi:glucose-6-phosphate isomerase [Trichlorobacter thiogenes]|uniref:Glucose-6-phosphate isomerase n=1 Tax=Trichlorobacter thiogenes TaxID=115783 RepID=A0A1T4RPQ6_9BACT|nr:glucose-6-phosphate isomerase [Trichlorobacter thiogenes]SKA17954.1 glucose-6-phosphate isomerase [Trichlorobacter thiogenes]
MPTNTWNRFQQHLCHCPEIGLWLDISRMNFDDEFLNRMEPAMQQAFDAMLALEQGSIANPDEGRMVGHYWLRTPTLAPTPEIQQQIESTVDLIESFSADIHSGKICAPGNKTFTKLLIIGIGGSALGPQFVADALGNSTDKMTPYFLDNTDPDGMDRVFSQIGNLSDCLVIVISKSGSTKETRNGMLEAQAAWQRAGLDFSKQAVAITGNGSQLDKLAVAEGWITRFPMWDWVGGRTSVTSAVGLLPAALQGINIRELLRGAQTCDQITRSRIATFNPASLMALMWHHATGGNGDKDMVMLPYKDRLLLFSRYLQQLIMESIGKQLDLDGNVVGQGLTVYGNKGSTDQHAYVQQLREGVHNFFVTFIEVLQDRQGSSMQVEQGVTSGDFLFGFLYGTRQALSEKGRESMTITVERIDAATIGALIALFERTVGLYASLVNINAYHQPGVEAGKKAAGTVIELQKKVQAFVQGHADLPSPEKVAEAIGVPEQVEIVYAILRRLQSH